MKKLQRILAILGVVLLLALYASTMIFALSGSENSIGWFKASIIVPVLLYAYMMIYRYLKNRNK